MHPVSNLLQSHSDPNFIHGNDTGRHWYFGGDGPLSSQLTPLLEPDDASFKTQCFSADTLWSFAALTKDRDSCGPCGKHPTHCEPRHG